MTRRRTLPMREAREWFTYLKDEIGLDLAKCAIDIGPDGVKVSPPANEGESLAHYIDRPAHHPKAGKGR